MLYLGIYLRLAGFILAVADGDSPVAVLSFIMRIWQRKLLIERDLRRII
jgi:hypothetical protein